MKHRELDNILSSAFMFLPEGFRLPGNLRNPTAVHTNLNLHAGVICLHHAAIDKIETFGLSGSLKALSQTRLRTAAEEIVNIVKLSSHVSPGFVSLQTLYCATGMIKPDISIEKPFGCFVDVLRSVGVYLRCQLEFSSWTL